MPESACRCRICHAEPALTEQATADLQAVTVQKIHRRLAQIVMEDPTAFAPADEMCIRDRISAIRFSTLEAICETLDCQPGDILEYRLDEKK